MPRNSRSSHRLLSAHSLRGSSSTAMAYSHSLLESPSQRPGLVGFCCSGNQRSGASALDLLQFWKEAALVGPGLGEGFGAGAGDSTGLAILVSQ